MSYEGYEQCICKNGHYYVSHDSYYNDEDNCYCGAERAWTNMVDDTNCDNCGYIPPELFIHESPGRLKIPSKEEQEALRTYRDSDNLYFIESNNPVVLPSYKPCVEDLMVNTLVTVKDVTIQPRVFPCS